MSVMPTWQAAATGMPGQASAVNQLLGTHSSQYLYGGTQQTVQSTASTSYTTTAGQWLSQTVMTGAAQTAVGSVRLQINTVGGSPLTATIPPLTVALYADSGGNPSGAPLGSVTVGDEYVYTAPYWVTLPLPATGLTANWPYHLVTQPAGSGAHYYAWHQSNQTSGAATSPDGATWTAQPYGLTYQLYDQTINGIYPTVIYQDNGAAWTQLTYDTANRITGITEYTAGQTASGYAYATHTVTYDTANTANVTGVR